MKKDRIIALFCSIFLHAIFIFALIKHDLNFQVGTKETPAKEEEVYVSVRLLPKADKLTISDRGLSESTPTYYQPDEKICSGQDKFYLGIGVIYQFGSNLLTHVPEQYPAYKAGLRVGDEYLNPGEDPVNGYLRVEIIRESTKMEFKVKVYTICYSGD